MRRPALVLVFALSASMSVAQSVPELFQKMKEQVRAEKWTDALATIEEIDVEASRPANASLRPQLEAPLALYRGVCEANLGQSAEAKASFEKFLADQPNVSLDPYVYSKKTIAAFEEARKGTEPAAPTGPSTGSHGLFTAFQEFKAPPSSSDPPDERWARGPVGWIMTSDEKKTWENLRSGSDRVEFVEKFWEARNPNPGSPDNVFETTFERRVAFADARFNQSEEKRGSLTDRGMVFVVLGPPTYSGRRPIRNGEDASDEFGTSTVTSADVALAADLSAITADRIAGPGSKAAESSNNYQEVWHYRKELLSKGVSFIQVDAVFITKQGYGKNVLQRDPDVLATLNAAKQKPQ
jgi:GWxTD domain-containing protein